MNRRIHRHRLIGNGNHRWIRFDGCFEPGNFGVQVAMLRLSRGFRYGAIPDIVGQGCSGSLMKLASTFASRSLRSCERWNARFDCIFNFAQSEPIEAGETALLGFQANEVEAFAQVAGAERPPALVDKFPSARLDRSAPPVR